MQMVIELFQEKQLKTQNLLKQIVKKDGNNNQMVNKLK